MSYTAGDLVKFIPQHPVSVDAELVGMVGMVLGAPKSDEGEYLSVLWADGETIDTHLNDLEPFDWRPCVPRRG